MPSLPDAVIEEISRNQHGLVTRRQLLQAGVHSSLLYRRLRSGRLRRIHRGVYQVGSVPAPLSREMAAVLWCGPGAALSHQSAAVLWALVAAGSARGPVDVTVPGRDLRRTSHRRIHRVDHLPEEDVTHFERIPVTTPGRTIVDLSGFIQGRPLERVLARADRKGLVDPHEVHAIATRLRRQAGVPSLLAYLEADDPPAFTRSEAEERLLSIVRSGDLPSPRLNAKVGSIEVDFLWENERLIVEVDGFEFHRTRSSFEADRRRDAKLARSGYQVIRVTWQQLTSRRDATLVVLAQALAVRPGHGLDGSGALSRTDRFS